MHVHTTDKTRHVSTRTYKNKNRKIGSNNVSRDSCGVLSAQVHLERQPNDQSVDQLSSETHVSRADDRETAQGACSEHLTVARDETCWPQQACKLAGLANKKRKLLITQSAANC